jgi:hypothetical protein
MGAVVIIVTACGGVVADGANGDAGAGGGAGTGGAATVGSGGRSPGSTCGNGRLDSGEMCDGRDFGTETCATATMGFRGLGTLRCTPSCVIDVSACSSSSGAGGAAGACGLPGAGAAFGCGGFAGAGKGGTFGSGATTGAGGVTFGSGGSGVGASAGSFGDPHVLTLDGLKYDFQAVGEFILVEDATDPEFVVQVRQGPFKFFTTLSVNTAVAARVGGDRVAFYAGQEPPLRVNGVARRIDGTLRLADGGAIVNEAGGYVVDWPSGERLTVNVAWGSLLNVGFHPADRGSRRRLRGLLGVHDCVRSNDLTTRSGTTLTLPAKPEEVYGVFGQSYRIRNDESLFDYSAAESTATYTDVSFPLARGPSRQPLPTQIEAAERTCSGAGVKGAGALELCALDVALTGDVGFAKAAAGDPSLLHGHWADSWSAADVTPDDAQGVRLGGAPCSR